jgi:hypothetical protein
MFKSPDDANERQMRCLEKHDACSPQRLGRQDEPKRPDA